MRYHLSLVRSSAYCRRQAYYRMRDEPPEPSPEQQAVRELAYHYPEFLESPSETQRELGHPDLNQDALESLRVARQELSEWREIARPAREEHYVEGDHLHGTTDKVVRVSGEDGGEEYAASLVKAGSPPRNGVWRPTRVEAAAAARLLEYEFPTASRAYVEYPRYGVIRCVGLGVRDYRVLERTLEALEFAEDRVPSRTRNRAKCRSCSYREECGVRTESLISMLRRHL